MSLTANTFSPAQGTAVTYQMPLTFKVTNPGGSILILTITASFTDSLGNTYKEIIYADGAFNRGYQNTHNIKATIANGFSFTVLRDGGWPATGVTLGFTFCDAIGNLGSVVA